MSSPIGDLAVSSGVMGLGVLAEVSTWLRKKPGLVQPSQVLDDLLETSSSVHRVPCGLPTC